MSTTVTAAQVADKALDKADVLVNKVAEVSSNMFEAAANMVTKGIEQYGQQAIDAVLWVVRIDAIQQLVFGLFGMIAFVIGFVWYLKMMRKYVWIEENGFDDKSFITLLTCLVLVLFSLPTGVYGFNRLTDVWLYTAVAKPELYLVKQTIDVVKKKIEAPTETKKEK